MEPDIRFLKMIHVQQMESRLLVIRDYLIFGLNLPEDKNKALDYNRLWQI